MRLCLAVLLAMLPVMALAQVPAPSPSGSNPSPTPFDLQFRRNDFPHPALPWSFWQGQAYGRVLGYIPVAPQEVTLSTRRGPADGLSGEPAERVVTIPGYYVAETTTGYVYPERWALQPLGAGVYQWRLLPLEFRRR
jgi:hypothetical protein